MLTIDPRTARDELVAALGTDAPPQSWMVFMRAVRRLLPELSSGRPSRDAIANSFIGALGFGSWREMIEASVEAGGLGWSWHTWRQWSRAWHIVQQHPWLEQLPITASAVMTLYERIRAAGVNWPTNAAELDQLQEQLGAQRSEQKEASRAALQRQVEELTATVRQLEEESAQLEAARAAAAARVADLEAQADRLKDRTRTAEEAARKVRADLQRATGQLEEARAARDAALSKAAQPRPLPRLTRWQHLVAALLGQ